MRKVGFLFLMIIASLIGCKFIFSCDENWICGKGEYKDWYILDCESPLSKSFYRFYSDGKWEVMMIYANSNKLEIYKGEDALLNKNWVISKDSINIGGLWYLVKKRNIYNVVLYNEEKGIILDMVPVIER